MSFRIATRSVKKLSLNNKRQKTSATLRYLYSQAFITPALTTSASVTSQLRRLSVKSIKLQIKSALRLLAFNALQSPQASAGGGGCSRRLCRAPEARGSAGAGQSRCRSPRSAPQGGRAAAPRVGAGSGGAGPGSATRSAAAAAAAASERVPLAHARCPCRTAP